MASFATYAAGFGAPLGAVLSGHFGDRLGRKTVLVTALLVIVPVTAAIGALPPCRRRAGGAGPTGVAARVAGACRGYRMGRRGRAVGGACTARAAGPFGSFTQLGSPAGTLLATSVFSRSATSPDPPHSTFGRRIPFPLSVFLVAIGLFVQLKLPGAEIFSRLTRREELARLPIVEVLRTDSRNVVITTGLRLAQVGLLVLLTMYSVTYLQDSSGKGGWVGLIAVLISSALGFVSTPGRTISTGSIWPT